MAKVQIKVMGLAETKEEYSVCLLMMDEVNGTRKLPLLISEHEAQSILIALKNVDVERPLTHDLMVTMLADLRSQLTEAYIYKFEEEVFYAYLIINDMGRQVIIDSRASDAIALAVRTDAPIYVEESIIDELQSRIRIVNADNVPLDVVSDEDLENQMKAAIEREDYEHAAKVRDEINRRKEEQIN